MPGTRQISATSAAGDEKNQCHDLTVCNKPDALLQQFPNSHLVVMRGYAMRLGICRLIDEKKISLEIGIQVFEIEWQRAIMECSVGEAARKRNMPLPINLDPLG